MTILTLIIGLAATGVVLWAVNRFVPMDGKVKTLLNVVVIVVLVVVCLDAFGVIDAIRGVRVPRVHG